MAEKTKKTSKEIGKALVWIILALVVVGLGGFGATNFGGGVGRLGSVGDTEITMDEYARALSNQLRQIQQQTGKPMTLAQAQQMGIDRAVLQQLVSSAALDDATAALGVSVGDDQVREQVLAIPQFNGPNGTFDKAAYEYALQNAGLTVQEFEQGIRTETARSLLQGAVGGGFAAPEGYVRPILSYVAERRSFTWAPLTEANLTAPLPEPTDADLRAFHQSHAAQFTIPETKRITYAVLTPDDMMDSIVVPESELMSLYERRIDEYRQPERRLVERLVFPSADEAAAAKARLDSGETTFDALVAERGLKLDDIDLGDVTEKALGDAGPAVFALAAPGVVGPVDTALGPALIRVNGILAAQDIPFDEVKTDLLEEYSADAARRAVADKIDGIDDLLAGGATLEDLGKEAGMRLGQIDWRPGIEDGMAAYQSFRDAAAKVTADDFPEIVQLEDGGIFALRLDETVPPTLQPFEEVADQVRAAWRADALATALTTEAEAMAGRLSEGATFEGMALTPRNGDALTRDGFVEGAPADLLKTVFAMAPGEARAVSGGGSVALVRLDAVIAPEAGDPEADALRTAIANQAAQSLSQDALTSFVRAIEEKAGITLDQSAINAVHAQFP